VRVVVIEGNPSVAEVHAQVIKAVAERLDQANVVPAKR